MLIVNYIFFDNLRPHLGQIFSSTAFNFSLDYSLATLIAHFLNIPLTVIAIAYLVEKANKCLDFVMTTIMFHLLFIVCVYKFPSTLAWWLWHALIVTITVLSSEFICMKLETAEIKFSLGHII